MHILNIFKQFKTEMTKIFHQYLLRSSDNVNLFGCVHGKKETSRTNKITIEKNDGPRCSAKESKHPPEYCID